jgi:hypothetical protein
MWCTLSTFCYMWRTLSTFRSTMHYQSIGGTDYALTGHSWDCLCIIRAEVGLTVHFHPQRFFVKKQHLKYRLHLIWYLHHNILCCPHYIYVVRHIKHINF